MTVNINAASISSARFAEQASAPATPAAGFVRLYANNATLPLLSMVNDAGTVTSYLGNSSGSGTGITFPATQSPSSDANTLDDYEEGTWTPVLSGTAGSAGGYTATIAAGRYTKIGRVVSITAGIVLSNAGSWTGELRCSLPTVANTGNDVPRGSVGMEWHTFTGQLSAEIATSTSVRFNLTTSGGAGAKMQYSGLTASTGNYLSFSLVYETTT